MTTLTEADVEQAAIDWLAAQDWRVAHGPPANGAKMSHSKRLTHDAPRRRRSIRLKGHDYSRAGAYFVTIVTQGRLCVFGEVVGEQMRLNEAGAMAQAMWEALPRRFPGIDVDAFVVMPNHIHGIVIIDPSDADQPVGVPLVGTPNATHAPDVPDHPTRATTRVAPTNASNAPHTTLGDVVRAHKSLTTVEYASGVRTLNWPPFERRLWQRNYYEHIVRDEESLSLIRQYILDNPAQWDFDRENPAVLKPKGARP